MEKLGEHELTDDGRKNLQRPEKPRDNRLNLEVSSSVSQEDRDWMVKRRTLHIVAFRSVETDTQLFHG
ncbi:MAG UNVERIFIED_CONTAM: hypothetical protein LVR18_13100 [Planctomycetaceae bacterium]|jgi:hypothetical protein